MAVPRNRHSNARKNKRRSHMAKKPLNLTKCNNCSSIILPHKLCPSCGFYGKREVVNASAQD